MAYKLHFISLGCAKNMVNCEQMMALCRDAGMELSASPEGVRGIPVVKTFGQSVFSFKRFKETT